MKATHETRYHLFDWSSVSWEDTQDPWFWIQFMPEHTDGARVVRFVETRCTHSDGDLLGEPFLLEPWQVWVISLMFEIDPAAGRRRWREFVLVIPRGNGKSALVSALGFYLLLKDGEGAPEVYSTAWGEEQAGAVFEPAKLMWESSPKLQRLCRKFAKSFVSTTKRRGFWKVTSRLASTKHGKKTHALLNDEYHVHPKSDLRDTFIKAMHKRRQAIAIDVTTEGVERAGPLEDLQRGFRDAVEQGLGTVQTIHPGLQVFRTGRKIMVRWGVPYEIEDEIQITSELVRMVNPLSVIDVDELIADEAPPAPGKKKADFHVYHMNHAVRDAGGEGVPEEMWDACADPDAPPLVDGQEVVLGIDGGYRVDCSAVVTAGFVADGRARFDAEIWRPPRESGLELDLEDTVHLHVFEQLERYRVRKIVGDPALLVGLFQQLQKRIGADIIREYRFAWGDAGPDSVTLLEAIQTGADPTKPGGLVHDGDLTYRKHVLNMRTRYGPNRAWRWDDHPDKGNPNADVPNDAGIASMLAAGELLGGDQSNLYGSRGLLIV